MHRLNFFLLLVIAFMLSFSILLFPKNETPQEPVANGCTPDSLSGEFSGELIGYFEGSEVEVAQSALAMSNYDDQVLGDSNTERWIEVDLSDQTLTAWEGNQVYLTTLVSTGLPWYPTPTGEFRIWIKLRSTKMEGGQGKYYYYLPNVPYVMYFENDKVPGRRGYGLHGTYWHDDFGTPRSHGCVNLPTDIAGRLYYWASPNFTRSQYSAKSTDSNPGTKIVIHE